MEPNKYRKRPVVVEAIQWTGKNYKDILEFAGKKIVHYFQGVEVLMVRTLEGDMFASRGDYIVKGIRGEVYPCKPDVFQETYEEAGETSTCTATNQPCAMCQPGPCGSRKEAHHGSN